MVVFFLHTFRMTKSVPFSKTTLLRQRHDGRALEDVLGELQHEFPRQRVRGKEGLPQGPAINQAFRRGYVIEGVSCGEGLVKKG